MSKREFIYQLGLLLESAGLGVSNVDLSEDECYALVEYSSGSTQAVCIECDSFAAIILDVTRAAMY